MWGVGLVMCVMGMLGFFKDKVPVGAGIFWFAFILAGLGAMYTATH